jgi:hypothetical protein
MNRDQALAKIKKCLALSKSSNANEAGIAMRQAQALMAEHMLTPEDVALADINTKECSTRTNSGPKWEVALGNIIATAFGCSVLWTRDGGRLLSNRVVYKHAVVFYGLLSAPEIAGYAWDVLSRQCAKGRLAHIRAQPARCKPITLTARGDLYAMGWVRGVSSKLESFAQPEKNTLLIEQFKAAKWPGATSGQAADRTKGRNVTPNDFFVGHRAGSQAELNHGVSGAAQQGLLT